MSFFTRYCQLCIMVLMMGHTFIGHAQPHNDRPAHAMPQGPIVVDRYIVVFRAEVANAAQEANRMVRDSGGQLHHVYTHAIKGFSATLPSAALNSLRNNPLVQSVEEDRSVLLNQTSSPQSFATWGLDRIDQLNRPLNQQYAFNYTGNNVYAFVIDTGIRADHVDFSGRVLAGYSVIGSTSNTQDCNGHGTHVSGTIGGTTWGVAKRVKLIPVRVLDCNGSGLLSGVIAGLDWVAKQSTLRPAVANMSLGSSKSDSVNAAVAGAVNAGVTVVVAAGNDNSDACKYSPASEPSAITVGATTSGDARSSFSNFGACVDVFAPGSYITSAWIDSNSASNTISGTSMASPHVAGVAALALEANPNAKPSGVIQFIVGKATPNQISGVGSASPNLLVYSLADGAPADAVTKTVAIQNVTWTSQKSGKNWTATASITVREPNTGSLVPSAKVVGTFNSTNSTITVSCVTSSTGTCSVNSGTISSSVGTVTYTVSNVSGLDLVYNAGQNTVTSVAIPKP